MCEAYITDQNARQERAREGKSGGGVGGLLLKKKKNHNRFRSNNSAADLVGPGLRVRITCQAGKAKLSFRSGRGQRNFLSIKHFISLAVDFGRRHSTYDLKDS